MTEDTAGGGGRRKDTLAEGKYDHNSSHCFLTVLFTRFSAEPEVH